MGVPCESWAEDASHRGLPISCKLPLGEKEAGTNADEEPPTSGQGCACVMPGAARFVSYRRSEGSRCNAAVLVKPDQWQNRHFAGNGDSALESLRQHARNMDQDAGRLRSGASAQTSKTDSGGALRASASGVNRRREILRDHFPHATKAEAETGFKVRVALGWTSQEAYPTPFSDSSEDRIDRDAGAAK